MKTPEKLILTCFFLSGLSALVYEVLWVRMMVLIFGATTLATSTVLTAYMGGLAIGSFLFGRYRPRFEHPLLLYAVLEIGIGCYALLIPSILSLLVPIYQKVWAGFAPSFYIFSLLRFLMVGMILLLPTALMGATLPVLSRIFEKYSGEAGRRIGMLYALNTLGAVVGVFSTGFIFLPAMGVQRTTLMAAGVNLCVGIFAILLWRHIKGLQIRESKTNVQNALKGPMSHEPLGIQSKTANDLSLTITPVSRRVALSILVCLGISGFAAMVYEVSWSRALSLVLGSTIYAFSAMLTTFLIGLALGSFLSALVVEKLKSTVMVFGLVQIGIGASGFLTLSLLGEIPYLFVKLYLGVPLPALLTPVIWFSIALWVMLLPTFLMGTLFPLAIKILHLHLPTFGRLAGEVYAVNTLGAILGAFCGGFVLIPLFGIQGSALSMVYLNLIVGLIVILIAPLMRQRSKFGRQGLLRWGLAGGVLLLAGSLVGIKPSWDARIMSTGVFLQLPQHAALLKQAGRNKFYQELERDRELLFYKEGITATITVERHRLRGLSMRVNGRSEAGERFMRTQALIGHIPMILAQQSDDVLIIGFGSGATVGSVAQYPVKRIRVVELEPAVLEASRFFEPENHRPLDDSRVEVQINDGRNTLLVSSETFDVIISQPSLPWITGASNLFTREFFNLGARHLKDGGIFGQWISTDAVSLENFKSLLKAFHEVFPSTWLFETVKGDFLLVGSKERLQLNLDKLEGVFRQESIRQDLLRVGVQDPYDLLILYQLGGPEVDHFVSTAVSNTDDNVLVELTGPTHYYGSDQRSLYATIQEEVFSYAQKGASSGQMPLWMDPGHVPETLLLKVAQAGLKNNNGPWSLVYTDLSLRHRETADGHHLRGRILASLVNQMDLGGESNGGQSEKILEEVVAEYEKALKLKPDLEDAIPLRYDLGAYYFRRSQLETAARQYVEILKRESSAYEALANLGKIYLQQGRLDEALKTYQKALGARPQAPEALFELGFIYSNMNRYPQAIRAYEKLLEVAPEYLKAYFYLARAYELSRQRSKAVSQYQQFLTMAPSDADYGPYRTIAQAQLARLLEGEGGP